MSKNEAKITKNNSEKYEPSSIEQHWQSKWEDEAVYQSQLNSAKKPFYNLMMFPYPSAEGLHVGSVFTFSGADIYGRFKRMQGHDVFEPMGLDGFGIHSENHAIKTGTHPMDHAKRTEENFYRQLHAIGNGFDWKHKAETYDPGYYKWTQWLFTELFKAGLAYRKKSPVNFCPSCKTVLADEQVIDTKCERCGTIVEKRDLEQWFFRITRYADRLLNNIPDLNWSEKVKIAQKNWIGKKTGINITYPVSSDFNYVFLHAYKSSPNDDFWPWLKKNVEATGARVSVPQLPNTQEPDIEEQVEYLLNNFNFNEKTIIVAHSLGGVAALKLLPILKTKIAKLILVAPPLKPIFKDKQKRPQLEKATDWNFDLNAVKEKAEEIVVIKDIEDHIVLSSHPDLIAKELNAKLVQVEATEKHFNSSEAQDILKETINTLTVFTTRPDTNFGATFIALAPDAEITQKILNQVQDDKIKKEINKYIEIVKNKSEIERQSEGKEKTGVFTGLYAINQLTGYKMPIWVSDFVLSGFGTGALVGVPGHDKRDFEFASKFNLEVKRVVVGADGDQSQIDSLEKVQEEEGTMINSGFLSGMNIHKATEKIMDYIEEKGYGKKETTFRLRDWLISRQRYWGPPIPMIFCEKCAKDGKGWFNSKKSSKEEDFSSLTRFGQKTKETVLRIDNNLAKNTTVVKQIYEEGVDPKGIEPSRQVFVEPSPEPGGPTPFSSYKINSKSVNSDWDSAGWYPVEEKDLPLKLPFIKNFKPMGTGVSPLASHPEFYSTTCPECGGEARRETDVSDTFLDSSWYFLRYLATDWNDMPFPSEKLAKVKSDDSRMKESKLRSKFLPVAMYIGGAEHSVLHLMYTRFVTMALSDLGLINFEEPFARFYAHGLIIKDGAKMSKSRGNVINPDVYIDKYGADALRLYLHFLGPLNQDGDFRDSGIEGMFKFLKRVWVLFSKAEKTKAKGDRLDGEGLKIMHGTIAGVTEDLEHLRYNTAIAKLMTWYNFLVKQESLTLEEIEVFLKLLAPFAPHLTEELFQMNRKGDFHSIHLHPWPEFNPDLLKDDTVTIAVQVNGKMRDTLKAQSSMLKDQNDIESLAKESSNTRNFLQGKKIIKVIYVPGKVINFVVS